MICQLNIHVWLSFVGRSLPPLRGPDLMGLIRENGDCSCNPFVVNMKISINSHNVCWKERGILKCRSKLTVEWMCAFPWPRKIRLLWAPWRWGMLHSAHVDMSYMQWHGGVSAGLPQHNGSFACPRKKYDQARLQTSRKLLLLLCWECCNWTPQPLVDVWILSCAPVMT